MTAPAVTSLDLRTIKAVLNMGDGLGRTESDCRLVQPFLKRLDPPFVLWKVRGLVSGRATSENPTWRDLLNRKREFVESKAEVEVYRPLNLSRRNAMHIEEAAVVLHLRIRVKAEHQLAFFKYIDDAFPLFMKDGDSLGVVYQSTDDPDSYDEVFYYRTEEAYLAGEKAVAADPATIALLKRWRALLEGPPQVEVYRPIKR